MTRLNKHKKGIKRDDSIMSDLTSDDGGELVTLGGFKVPKREKEFLQQLVSDINMEDQPFPKVNQTSIILTAVKFFAKHRAKYGYNKLISQMNS